MSIVEQRGYYLPWVLSGTVISSIAYKLLLMLSLYTSVWRWIGFQILYGSGCGAAATGVSISYSVSHYVTSFLFSC